MSNSRCMSLLLLQTEQFTFRHILKEHEAGRPASLCSSNSLLRLLQVPASQGTPREQVFRAMSLPASLEQARHPLHTRQLVLTDPVTEQVPEQHWRATQLACCNRWLSCEDMQIYMDILPESGIYIAMTLNVRDLPLLDGRLCHITLGRGTVEHRIRLDALNQLVADLQHMIHTFAVRHLAFQPYGRGLHFQVQPATPGAFLVFALQQRLMLDPALNFDWTPEPHVTWASWS